MDGTEVARAASSEDGEVAGATARDRDEMELATIVAWTFRDDAADEAGAGAAEFCA